MIHFTAVRDLTSLHLPTSPHVWGLLLVSLVFSWLYLIHFHWNRFLKCNLEMCPFVCMWCVGFMCVSTCVGVHSCMCMEAKGRPWVSCSITFHINPLGWSLSLSLKFTDLAGLSGQWAPGIYLSLQLRHRGYSHTQPGCAFFFTLVLRMWTWILRLVQVLLPAEAIFPSQEMGSILKSKPDVRNSSLVHPLLNCLVDIRMDIDLRQDKSTCGKKLKHLGFPRSLKNVTKQGFLA